MNRRIAAIVGASLVVGIMTPAVPVYAGSTVTVTTTVDELNQNGNCSLREAIRATNLNTAVDACPAGSASSADVIVLPPAVYSLTIPDVDFEDDESLSGDLDLSGSLVIRGGGASTTTISGAHSVGVLEVLAGANVTLEDLTVADGALATPITDGVGAGIFNAGTLRLVRSIVRDTTVTNGPEPFEVFGGTGIINRGTLEITNSTVTDNSGGTGGVDNAGELSITGSVLSGNHGFGGAGAIGNSGTLTVSDTSLTGNLAPCGQGFEICPGGFGGAIGNTGRATVNRVTISNNSGGIAGGGIWNGGSLNLADSVLNGNTTTGGRTAVSTPIDGDGGGIFNDTSGVMTVLNATISNNSTAPASVDNRGGGGIFNAGNLTVTNATITGNSATNGRPARNAFQGGGILNFGSVRLANTIISGNVAGGGGNECFGSLFSVGSNLIRSLAACTLIGVTTGNLIGIDPQLGPLRDNGGQTLTHGLLVGSPAIDAVVTDTCPATDQRGVARPQDGDLDGRAVCDIGAFELIRGRGTPPPNAVPPARAVPVDTGGA